MIQIENLSKSFGPKVILDQINFLFPIQKRIALTGPNGTGKSTLLNILCGLDHPDSGQVHIHSGKVLGYLPQEPNPNPASTTLAEAETGADHIVKIRERLQALVEKMANHHDDQILAEHEKLESEFRHLDGYALSAKATAILNGLGFRQEMHQQNPMELSGGWRMRLELAKIFIRNPDFLILDEPTNHLDLPSLVWVEKYLQSFDGTLLFVSHDRSLLEKLANHTLLLNDGDLESYAYGFEMALEKKAEKLALESAQVDNIQRKRKKMEDFVTRFGAKATKAKQAQSRVKMIAKLDAKIDAIQGDKRGENTKTLQFKLPEPPPCGRQVLTLNKLAIGYEKTLASNISLEIERKQKIAVIGANGIGKSTLLKTIVGQIPQLAGDINSGHKVETVYFSQNHEDTLNFERSCVDNILMDNSSIGEPEARSILGAFLFSGDDVDKKVRVLSGGEKSRVALAKILVSRGNFLLLDEPTNHLDMDSVAALVDTVQDFKGTLLFVSHDRSFIDAVCTHVFVMLPDGRSCLFEGNIVDYQRLAPLQGFPDVLSLEEPNASSPPQKNNQRASAEESQKTTRPSYAEAKERKRQVQSLERKIAKLEQNMSDLKAEKQTLQDQLIGIDPSNYEKIREVSDTEASVDQKILLAEEEWLELSEQLQMLEEGS